MAGSPLRYPRLRITGLPPDFITEADRVESDFARLEKEKQQFLEGMFLQTKAMEEMRKMAEISQRVLNQRISELELENINMKAQHQSLLTMRPLLEIGLRVFRPLPANAQHTTASARYKNVLMPCLVTPTGNLTQSAMIDFASLGEVIDPKDVARDLQDLYHELSQKTHHPNIKADARLREGHVCGDDRQSLRIATALALLQLQREVPMLHGVDIIYTDENFNPLKFLRGGACYEV